MAADHGVADEGVSAYPPEVTAQMLLNFARGGAAINVLARQAGAAAGGGGPGRAAAAARRRAGRRSPPRSAPGTANFARGPAMTRGAGARRRSASASSWRRSWPATGVDLVGLGEMGIGNTTAASALAAAFTGAAAEEVTGRGTGIDDAGLRAQGRGRSSAALAVNRPDPADPLDVLAKAGRLRDRRAGRRGAGRGGRAACRWCVDGFIASAAALVAVRLRPPAPATCMASHRSVEAGHAAACWRRWACGRCSTSSCASARAPAPRWRCPWSTPRCAILHEMATFDSAGVSDSGR